MSLHINDLEGVEFTEKQLDLWRRIAAQISTDPESLDMLSWENSEPQFANPQCGTTRCAAGWALWLSDDHRDGDDIADTAIRLTEAAIALDPEARDQADVEGMYSFPARLLLGLDEEQANSLFLYSNDDEAEALIKAVAAGETPKGPVETDE